jgi:hypothetical protein
VTTTIESINVDKNFVNELIVVHGPVQSMHIVKRCFGEDMNPNVKDDRLRIMLWQILHSMDILENSSNISFYDLPSIELIAEGTDSKNTQTVSRHLKSALDNIIEYVTE